MVMELLADIGILIAILICVIVIWRTPIIMLGDER